MPRVHEFKEGRTMTQVARKYGLTKQAVEARVRRAMTAVTIFGAPRTKKTSNRLVSAGRRQYVLPSKAWTTWCRTARFIFFDRDVDLMWSETFACYGLRRPIAASVSCSAIFYRDADRGDLVGYMQGLADLLEKRGILKNDRQIVSWDGTRLALDREIPRVEVLLVAPPAAGGGPGCASGIG